MDMQELNQLVIDQTMIVHDHCMDHCLDKDSEAYRFWSSQREHSLALCKHAALAAQEQSAYITRFSTHTETFRMRYERIRTARIQRELEQEQALAYKPFEDVEDVIIDDGFDEIPF